MKNLLIIILLVVSVTMASIIIIKCKNQPQPNMNNQIALHSDQEITDAACPTGENPKWLEGKVISCEKSPNGKFVAKFFYNGYSVPDRYYELFVVDTTNKLAKRIWAGDFRTLGWEWRKDNQIEVKYNCGSGCQATKILNMNESVSIADYQDGRMSEENGWKIKFTGNF